MRHVTHPAVNALTGEEYFRAKLQFETSPQDLKGNMALPSLMVLDVRDRSSFDAEHIPGAVNIPLEELLYGARGLPKEKTIVCCGWSQTCLLASKAALELSHKGYKVQVLRGGMAEWKRSGLETENAETRAQAQY